MAGSTFGTIFRITTWGESHGKALGVVIDGCPAGVPLEEADIQLFMDRRKPGNNPLATARKEGDKVEILSGVFEGVTTGCPISIVVKNEDQHSKDYSALEKVYRPGHADYTYDAKYGIRDYRGGGRSSGRETIGRVAAGAVAQKVLKTLGVDVYAYTRSIGPIEIDEENFCKDAIASTLSAMPDKEADQKVLEYMKDLKAHQDSIGGVMECVVEGLPAGIGNPVFDKLDADLSKAIMSIGAVKAVEIGDGVLASKAKGSENNDSFVLNKGEIVKQTNRAGGILGGMSDGSPIRIRAHVKPTPSISQEQATVHKEEGNIAIVIQGRHDPVIVPRAVVVMECMTAITVLDALLINMSSKIEDIYKFYQ